MGSQRLPGKSLMDLAGAPLVGRIIERVKRCRNVERVVLATTELTQDDDLAALASEYGIDLFRGSENDLVDRYFQAARHFSADVVVRLPADNPVPEPAEIDRIIEHHAGGGVEWASNLAQVLGNGYPDGIGAEVFDFWTLEEVARSVSDPAKREHVHLNYFNYDQQQPVRPDRYRVGTVECPDAFRRPDLCLDVNTEEQYRFMRALYEELYPVNPEFHITDIIEWYDRTYSAHVQ